MDPEFWLERWQSNLTGFHQDTVNDYLLRCWPQLNIAAGSRILVPLCGKSLDLLWLQEQGYLVTGIELSQLAVEAFFAEHGLTPAIDKMPCGLRYRCDRLEVLCADYFSLNQQDTGSVTAFYRAALIALPAALRPAYVAHLVSLLDPGSTGLLVTLDYDQAQMDGPPFSVADAEVQRLFSAHYDTRQLLRRDVLATHERFRDKGLTALFEQAYVLSRH